MNILVLLQQLNWTIILPLLISLTSLAISLYTLWKIHLSPFKLLISFGEPTLKTYKITPKTSGGKSIWFIPSIHIPFTFINTGAKPGKVINLRIIFTKISKGINKTNKYEEIFEPRWCVNYGDYNKNRHDRFIWLKDSIENEWYPFFVQPKEPLTKHFILESSRWDEFPTGNFQIKLEILSDESNKWKELERYEFTIDKFTVLELKKGSSFCLPCKKVLTQNKL